ncbi:predicted protein [Plenodomus lingam JN3]|uniref:PD-(D/E)XK nuclease-like domain-containing protein n=1 Tax=Leptosphaeria maculans (strain JN3 / isolate v23.1.3 / race Av1-4-5-6-7-8) TaxID=985895 RepID=M1ZJL2_LEPMJ|nr:predicted protein [Plenodomus lingam JN3]
MSLPASVPDSSQRSDSPKRRRTDDDIDGIQPEQSASQLGSEATLNLNRTNTFSPATSRVSSGPKRSSSPTRESSRVLRSAWPPVLTESLNGLEEAPPQHVNRLGDWLVEGINSSFIPQGLQHVIKEDTQVGTQTIKPGDFDRSDMRSAGDMSALWVKVKQIFLNARDCKDGGRDENAWCDDVARPLVHLAIDLYGGDRWWFQNVHVNLYQIFETLLIDHVFSQSQSINPLYLSTISAPTLTDVTRRKPIDRKIDYVFSYSHRHSAISALYKTLDASNWDIGHTLDAFTKRTALFSGIEVKSASGSHTEAELQLSVWMSASLRKKEELIQAAQIPIDLTTIVEPALTIVGHDHSVYYAYPREALVSGRKGVHILGPDLDRFERLSTDSIRGIFRLIRLYGNLLKYGMDEGEDGYWGRFFRPILNKLAGV